MSIGPASFITASAAGAPLAQSKSADSDRTAQEATTQDRQVQAEAQAEAAAGIGQTDGQQHQANQRDADGRRIWELSAKKAQDEEDQTVHDTPQSRDASGTCGTQLDISG